jgi:hypothetical protein
MARPIKLELIGRTLFIGKTPRQLSIDGGIYCLECGNLIDYRETKYHLFNEHQKLTTNIIKKEAI